MSRAGPDSSATAPTSVVSGPTIVRDGVRDPSPEQPGSQGLTSAQARARLDVDGPNRMPAPPGAHPARELARQMVHFFAVMLWCAAVLAWLAGMPALAVAIATVVVLNGLFSFAQEHAADRAAARLRDMLPLRATVRRDGEVVSVEAWQLVVGDRVVLTAGDRVCADLQVDAETSVSVDESLLTGESRPARRGPGERVFAGTYVVQGRTEASVAATGRRTRIAEIAAVMQAARRPRSPLTQALHRVVRVVATVAVALGAGAFVVSLVLGRPPDESYLFAIGVTVALVPEGLLPTVTLSLSRAAQQMAHRHALVRRLDAVETLGCTTYICTDKTGTLTRNQMSVVRVWTAAGTVDVRGAGYEPTADVDGPRKPSPALVAPRRARCGARRTRAPVAWTGGGHPSETRWKSRCTSSRTGWAPPLPLLPGTTSPSTRACVAPQRGTTTGCTSSAPPTRSFACALPARVPRRPCRISRAQGSGSWPSPVGALSTIRLLPRSVTPTLRSAVSCPWLRCSLWPTRRARTLPTPSTGSTAPVSAWPW